MINLYRRALVIVKAAPTWLAVATTAITIFGDEFIALLPDATAAQVAGWLALAVAWLGAVGNVVRRVTPVLPEARGILPTDVPVTSDERWMASELDYRRNVGG